MPPRRKRVSTEVGTHQRRSAARPSGHLPNYFDAKKCMAWFREYIGPNETTLGPEGMEKFCEDIGVEPENIVMLVIAWHLNAANMGYFTDDEWIRGMTELKCDSASKLSNEIPNLRFTLEKPEHFKSIYRYAFDFARDKAQRSMELGLAREMLKLLLAPRWSLLPVFDTFLQESCYKVINRDQWYNVLEFSRSIVPDLSNYDEDGAWPVMLDDFVTWTREQQPQHFPTPDTP